MNMFFTYNFDMTSISTGAIVMVPVIVAIVQAIKLTNWIQDRFAPLVSLGVGIIISFVLNHEANDLSMTILSGVMYGLMASGLYSGVKTTMQAQAQSKRKGNNNNSGNDGNNFI